MAVLLLKQLIRTEMFPVALFGVALVVIFITYWLHKWWNPKCSNGRLPPGWTGYPIVGETFQFFSMNKSFDVPAFIRKRVQRYGPIFRTNLVGNNVVVSTDPEFNHFVVNQEGKLVELWYPDSFMKLIGRFTEAGNVHKYLRNLIMHQFGPESIKHQLPEIEELAHRTLRVWSSKPVVDVTDGIQTMFFEFGAKRIFSFDTANSAQNIKDNFTHFLDGLVSFPLYVPGTAFYKCVKGRNDALHMLREVLKKRQAHPRKHHGDLLDDIIEDMEKEGAFFTNEGVVQFLFALLFASFETISMALTLAIKYLTENPSVLQELTEEHEALLRNRGGVESPITWSEYKAMTYTSQVVNETLRLANIAPVIFRKALADIKVKGYTIPAGWLILVTSVTLHLDPNKYEDPFAFNPKRWDGMGSSNGSKDFYAFGGGVRLCAGADYAKLQLAIFLHCLVTKYKWKKVKGGETNRNPGLIFPNGFHIEMSRKTIK